MHPKAPVNLDRDPILTLSPVNAPAAAIITSNPGYRDKTTKCPILVIDIHHRCDVPGKLLAFGTGPQSSIKLPNDGSHFESLHASLTFSPDGELVMQDHTRRGRAGLIVTKKKADDYFDSDLYQLQGEHRARAIPRFSSKSDYSVYLLLGGSTIESNKFPVFLLRWKLPKPENYSHDYARLLGGLAAPWASHYLTPRYGSRQSGKEPEPKADHTPFQDVSDFKPIQTKDVFAYEVIGRGAQGVVKRVVDLDDGKVYAVKTCFSPPADDADPTEDWKDFIKLEVEHVTAAKHEYIVELLHHQNWTWGMEPSLYYEMMDGCAMGLIADRHACEANLDLRIVLKQIPLWLCTLVDHIATALAHCHSLDLKHYDIKPENILYIKDQDDNFTFKLHDFGISSYKDFDDECRGTERYHAPEAAKPGMTMGKYSDVWSFAITVLELAGFWCEPENSKTTDFWQQKLKASGAKHWSNFTEDEPNEVGEHDQLCRITSLVENDLLPPMLAQMLQVDPLKRPEMKNLRKPLVNQLRQGRPMEVVTRSRSSSVSSVASSRSRSRSPQTSQYRSRHGSVDTVITIPDMESEDDCDSETDSRGRSRGRGRGRSRSRSTNASRSRSDSRARSRVH